MLRISSTSIAFRSQRHFCTALISEAKRFDILPGPKGPLNLGTITQYLPFIGSRKWDELHKNGFDMFRKYGPIVREMLVPGFYIVWLFDPNDFAKLLNDTVPGSYPRRQSHSALEKYRKDRPNIYRSGGLLPTNGSEWWRIRSEFQKGLSSPIHVRKFFPETDRITREFISGISPTGNNDNVPDFLPELSRLNLELVCFLIFDQRMGSFTEEERAPNSKTSRLIEAAEVTNSLVLPLEQGFQLWRYIPNKKFKQLCKAQELMENVAIDLVEQRNMTYKNCKDQRIGSGPLLEEYLRNGNIDRKDITGMAGDLLLGGIDTSTYTSSFLFYHLANNPTVQNLLYQETKQILPNPEDCLDLSLFNTTTKYTRAVLKESLRLNPISVGVGRILNQDTIFSGYMIPKGTNIVTNNFVACRSSQYFVDPEKFQPERWIKKSSDVSKINPYLVQPFGHGMRACIARRMAEQNILVLLIRLIRKFEIGWAGSEYMDIKSTLINKPDQPVRITFKLREY